MTQRFNPPPNWPQPPPGWTPPADWQPSPSWGPAPAGWSFWVDDEPASPAPAATRVSRGASGSPRVFISYRRADCQPQANGLYDGLSHRLKSASIFMDIDSIPPGADFEDHIRSEIQVCDLVLVLIGDNWLDRAPDQPDRRRIDVDDDFVRVEIESALASPNTRVIPVLVEGAEMPRPADLPESIRGLTRFNAIALDDRRWTADVGRLAATIESMSTPTALTDTPSPINPRPEPELALMPPPPVSGSAQRRTPIAGWVMIALPVLTFGLADFVPAIWAAVQRKLDRRFRLQMIIFAVVIGVLTYASLGVVGSTSIETLSSFGVAIWAACIVTATVVAVINRNPRSALPGTEEELIRRREREQYRNLSRRDPNLARTMAVGRPDLSRTYSDGGLLDLNSLSAEALSRFGALPMDEAQQIVAARRYAQLASLDDLIARCQLAEPTIARLRETAVFL